jgi:hypothetical protein
MKAERSFETPESNYPTTWRNNPANLLPRYKNSFATKQSFKSVISSEQYGNLAVTLAVPLPYAFSNSLAYY